MSPQPMNPRSAERLVRAARAAQALSETLWEELHEELHDPVGARIAELSERLADVSATIALLARPASAEPVADTPPGASVRSQAPGVPTIRDDERPDERPEAGERPRSRVPAPAPASGERAPSVSPREPPGARPSVQESPLRAVLVDELAPPAPAPEPSATPPEPDTEATSEIAIRDERHEDVPPERVPMLDQPGPWIGAIERRLERYERDRAPFAVLVVELVDVERLRHAELPGEISRLMGLVEAALSGELRPADSLTREAPGRYWLLAPDTDSGGARALVERLASAVRAAASHGGVPLEVAVGIAACPADGTQAQGLAAHAEVALYAARAAGRPVA